MSVVASITSYLDAVKETKLETNAGKLAFENTIRALCDDCVEAGYVPSPNTLKELQMLESVVADMKLSIDDDDDLDEDVEPTDDELLDEDDEDGEDIDEEEDELNFDDEDEDDDLPFGFSDDDEDDE